MIVVTVSGACNTGKTTIAMLITKTLMEAGIDVGLTDNPENRFESSKQKARLAQLALRGLFVSVETNQVNRHG